MKKRDQGKSAYHGEAPSVTSYGLGTSSGSLMSDSVKLKFTVAFYESDYHDMYVECASVKHGVLGSFSPCSEKWIEEFARKLQRNSEMTKKRRNRTPEPINDELTVSELPIWFVSHSGKTIAFSDSKRRKSVDILFKGKPKTISGMPEILYVISGESFYALERMKDGRYVALNLPNISPNGRVCMGNSIAAEIKVPLNELIKAYHLAFWSSSFNSHSDATAYDWEKADTFTYATRRNAQTVNLQFDDC